MPVYSAFLVSILRTESGTVLETKKVPLVATHPWIDFQLDLRRLQNDPEFWMLMGEAKSKCEHINSTPIHPDTARSIYSVYLSKGAAATTAIEGNTLSEDNVRSLIEGRLQLPQSREYLAHEVENIVQMYNEITSEVAAGRLTPLSPERIKAFNRQVLNSLEVEDWIAPGEFTSRQVGVPGYRGAPPSDCPMLIGKLCDWINGPDLRSDDIALQFPLALVRAIVAHLYVAWIHPFGDGNGRTARLVEFQLLLETGLVSAAAAHLMSNYYNQTRNRYYTELQKSSAAVDGELSFVTYALGGFVEGLREQLDYLKEQEIRVTWRDFVHDSFKDRGGERAERLKHLVLDIEAPTKRSDAGRVSPRVAAHFGRLSAKALQRDLRQVEEMGLVVRDGTLVRPNLELLTHLTPPRVVRQEHDPRLQ